MAKRRSYKRNPRILSTIQRGVMDAFAVTGGKVAYNLINRAIPFSLPLPGVAGDLVKGIGVALLGATALSYTKFLGADTQRFAIAGMFQGVVEGIVRAIGVPFVSTALGEYDPMGAYPRAALGAYPAAQQLPGVGVGAYDTVADEVAMSEQAMG